MVILTGDFLSMIGVTYVSSVLSPLKFLLRKAAKARIDRMVKDHPRRPDLNVPQWLKKEWATARKDDVADVLRQCNFDKDTWIHHVVSFCL